MTCKKCGKEVAGNFCISCGQPVASTEQTTSVYTTNNTATESRAPVPPVTQQASYGQAATYGQPAQSSYESRSASFNQGSTTRPMAGQPMAYRPAPQMPYMKKNRSPLVTSLVSIGGVALVMVLVLIMVWVIGDISKSETGGSDNPGLLASQGPSNYQPSDGGILPGVPVDMTGDYLYDIDDKDIAGETAPFTITLTSGHYVAGIDFPVGTYTIYAVGGYGSFVSNDFGGRGYVNQLLGTGDDLPAGYKEQYGEVFFPHGTMISFDGLVVRLESEAADVKNLGSRDNPLTQSVSLTAGTYTAGQDFDAGVYDVVAIDGTGSVVSSNTVAGISCIMSPTPEGSHQMEDYYNVILADYTTITVDEGMTILLVPSTGSEYS